MSGAEARAITPAAALPEAEDYAAWFRALADGTRVKIVSLLARHGRPMKVGEIVAAVQVGQSTVSQHLKVLKDAGLIRGEIDGPRVCYCIEPHVLRRLKALVGSL